MITVTQPAVDKIKEVLQGSENQESKSMVMAEAVHNLD